MGKYWDGTSVKHTNGFNRTTYYAERAVSSPATTCTPRRDGQGGARLSGLGEYGRRRSPIPADPASTAGGNGLDYDRGQRAVGHATGHHREFLLSAGIYIVVVAVVGCGGGGQALVSNGTHGRDEKCQHALPGWSEKVSRCKIIDKTAPQNGQRACMGRVFFGRNSSEI